MKIGYRNADLVIAGGGVAGFCAAIAAARLGVETLVVERNGYLGGMFTAGNMTVLNCPPAGGVGKEIVNTLMTQGHARRCPDDPPNYPIFHYASEYSTVNVVYDAEMAKILLFRMAKEAGVKLLLHTFITGTVMDRDTVKGIIVENKSGRQVVLGKGTIDATADGDVAALAGVPFRKGQTEKGVLFAMTLLVRLSHIDWPGISDYSRTDPALARAIRKAVDLGELPYYRPRTRDMPNYWGHPKPELSHLLNEDEALMWGGTVEGVDGTDVDDLTRAEMEAREQMLSELQFLKKYIPGFQRAKIESTGASVGVRDTRHIIGESTLTGKDVLDRRFFPDGVAYNVKGGFPANGIPYGCLVPKGIEGLLVSGNSISLIPGSTQMGLQLGSFNNLKDIPTMWTTGEAAGTALALSIRKGGPPRHLDMKELQKQLLNQGALVIPEKAKELEEAKLPSGKTVKEFYENLLSDMRNYWRGRGEEI